MRVLSFDPGGIRMGYAVLEGGKDSKKIKYLGMGILGLPQEGNESMKFQERRMAIISLWVDKFEELARTFDPDEIASEIVPAVGGGNFRVATQSQEADAAITTAHAMAAERHIPVKVYGASSIKARIGGHKDATKVKIRDGVLELMPQLETFRSQWTGAKSHYDDCDAVAVGLTHLGFDRRKRGKR